MEPAQALLLRMAGLTSGERVLDIACGPGAITFRAAEQTGAGGAVLGTDISARMVELASARATADGVVNVAFRRMAAEDEGLEPERFDAALCSLGLMYTPDPVRALARMLEALQPGGRAVAAVWGPRASCGWAEIFPIINDRVESEVCPLFFQLGTGDALSRAFAGAGFVDLRSERIRVSLEYEDGQDAVGAAFAGGPVALAYSRFSQAARLEAEHAYLASIEPYRSGSRYRIPGEFLAVSGVRPERKMNLRGGVADPA